MPKERDDLPHTSEHREETYHPANPPNSMVSEDTRRKAIRSYFLPLVIATALAGIGLIYWANRTPVSNRPAVDQDRADTIGTAGDSTGGFEPQPRPDSTGSEVELRGDDLTPITQLSDLVDVSRGDERSLPGRRVQLDNVQVESSTGDAFTARDGDTRVTVILPTGASGVRAGETVRLTGIVERDTGGRFRIRADQVSAQ